jgi:hypothetical protein
MTSAVATLGRRVDSSGFLSKAARGWRAARLAGPRSRYTVLGPGRPIHVH